MKYLPLILLLTACQTMDLGTVASWAPEKLCANADKVRGAAETARRLADAADTAVGYACPIVW